ncbi:DUF2000 family protein [Streptomyces sp. NPDC093984]|uniref:DUF2000 family protein n=1 Tax=Streptomyces sp. NPDC093984 TaxID=3366052 RepID=UPI00381DE8AA
MTIYVPTSTPVGEGPYRLRGRLSVEHMVIGVDEKLSAETMLNAAAIVSVTAGARMPGVRGLDLPDADHSVHTGTPTSCVAVLPTSQADMVALREAAVRADLGVCECPVRPGTAFGDVEPTQLLRSTPTREPAYAALALYGPRKVVEAVTSVLTAAGGHNGTV